MKEVGRAKVLEDLNLKDKRVFLRVDFNSPIKEGAVTDDTRIKAALPTIEYILNEGGKLVIASHLGRPKGFDLKYSLRPVAERLGELTDYEVIFAEDPMSDVPKAMARQLKKNQVIVLENLRFSPDEKQRTGKLAQHFEAFTEVYVNDAFGVCHRKDTSVYDLPLLIPQRAMGKLIEKEIKSLSAVRDNPKRPFAIVMGGAKVSDKIPMIENFLDKTDLFVIGGAMAFTFLKAMNVEVGKSLVEEDLVKFCKSLIQRLESRGKKILLPVDFYEADTIEAKQAELVSQISPGKMGFDIGPVSTRIFLEELKKCSTLLWNGPMGVFENETFMSGTKTLCEGLSKYTDILRVVGGGDTAAAATKFQGDFDHISTGGGASLFFLEGKELPGIEALRPLRKEILEDTQRVRLIGKEYVESEEN